MGGGGINEINLGDLYLAYVEFVFSAYKLPF